MSIYQSLKSVYHFVLPKSFRHWIHNRVPGVTPMKQFLHKVADHDELYTKEYYSQVIEVCMKASGGAMSESIVRDLKPRTAVDVGCGTGYLLSKLMERGVVCHGYEYATAGVEMCRSRGVEVTQFNIITDTPKAGLVDVVICTEVAEHLPASSADRLVSMLCSMSGTVVFTAATPGQEGTDHINLQPHEYWIEKFKALGFGLEPGLMQVWRKEWEAKGAASFFYLNLMVFKKA
jgi:hypothetical protein